MDAEREIDKLIRGSPSGRAAVLRGILAEFRRLRLERDAAREALRAPETPRAARAEPEGLDPDRERRQLEEGIPWPDR